MATTPRPTVRIAADVGGTFTDVILLDDRGGVRVHKLPSTPPNFERAVLDAVRHLLSKADKSQIPNPKSEERQAALSSDLGFENWDFANVAEVAHATTVATNAVLEHRGARTALITTRGFRDVLELRRIRAPQMYDLFFEKPR